MRRNHAWPAWLPTRPAWHGGNGHVGSDGMRMGLNDVHYDAFLANDRTPADPEIVRVERGGRIRPASSTARPRVSFG